MNQLMTLTELLDAAERGDDVILRVSRRAALRAARQHLAFDGIRPRRVRGSTFATAAADAGAGEV